MGHVGYLLEHLTTIASERFDSWRNALTGLGTARDKVTATLFGAVLQIDDDQLTALFHGDDMARKIVRLPVQEMVRKGWDFTVGEDVQAADALDKAMRDIGARWHLRDAAQWGRLYGGAAIIVGADDGLDPVKPLNEDGIQSIKFLSVVDKRYMFPARMQGDPFSSGFGKPEIWQITPQFGGRSRQVHASRVILFGGAPTDDQERARLSGWDYSVLQAVYDEIRRFENAWQASEHLMSDASQGIFTIKGLLSMIAGGNQKELQTRMELVDLHRSIARSIMVDADAGESFHRDQISFQGIATMLDKFMLRMSAAADIPVTILMGQSPSGMNATGESDFRWFYDNVQTMQENDLRPRLERLTRLVLLAKDGPTGGVEPDDWKVTFRPLWQQTQEEKAKERKTVAETDMIYIQNDVLTPEEVAINRFRPTGWSPETMIDTTDREAMLGTLSDDE